MEVTVAAPESTTPSPQAEAVQARSLTPTPPAAVQPVARGEAGGRSRNTVRRRSGGEPATADLLPRSPRGRGGTTAARDRSDAYVVALSRQGAEGTHAARGRGRAGGEDGETERAGRSVSVEGGGDRSAGRPLLAGEDQRASSNGGRGEAGTAEVVAPERDRTVVTRVGGPYGTQAVSVGGSRYDMTPVPGSPEATARKMDEVRRAALTAGDPGDTDALVALTAARYAVQARWEATRERMEGVGEQAGGAFTPEEGRGAERGKARAEGAGKAERDEAEKAEEDGDDERKHELPELRPLPDPARYRTPVAGENVYTPRYAAPTRTVLTQRALDPVHPLRGSVPQAILSGAQRRQASFLARGVERALGTAEESRPLLEFRI